jgi:ribosomal protein S12 methylthiotransferase accessory factor
VAIAASGSVQTGDFIHNFNHIFGKEVMNNVVSTITSDVRFHGVTKTSM